MSTYSITSLFPFRRVKITNFFKIEEPDFGSNYYVFLEPDQRFTPICHKCGSKAETLDDFFSNMPETKLNQIEAIAMDMWGSFY